MTRDEEANLRSAFEDALKQLRTGDEMACAETISGGTGTGAVMLVVGKGITFDVVSNFNRMMIRIAKTARPK